jgi:endonuclease YncB( thermonuclease family)
MKVFAGTLLALWLPLVSLAANPVLVGSVIKVTDGDTIKVQLSSGPINVRFDGIDAPEKAQPGGSEATAYLRSLVEGRSVNLAPVTQDRYNRMVAKVFVGKKNINAEMVAAGHAWEYRRYTRRDTRELCASEDAARRANLGLWAAPASTWIYPSDWRRLKRHQIKVVEDFSGVTLAACLAGVGKR